MAKGQIAAGAVVTGSVTVQMVNLAANQDLGQGVTVPLYLAAS
jgi:hypothetical protein